MRPLAIFHIVAGGALLALAIQTLLNVRHLPRLERMAPPSRFPRVAVLLPARNEAAHTGETVRAWTRQSYPDAGILVYDDASADGTGALAAAAGGDRVRVLRGGPLPAGWPGKTHASRQLREHADAEIRVFADTDVTPAASTLAATVSALESLHADALSALPRHESPRLAIRALVALQNWAPLAFVPLWAWRLTGRPLFTVMNGQCLAIRAAAYDRAGGFAAIRASLGEDVAFGRLRGRAVQRAREGGPPVRRPDVLRPPQGGRRVVGRAARALQRGRDPRAVVGHRGVHRARQDHQGVRPPVRHRGCRQLLSYEP